MATGDANWTPALPLEMDRSGYRGEAYFSVSYADLLPVNWSEFGEKFSVGFGERRTRETVDENVEIQRATDRVHS